MDKRKLIRLTVSLIVLSFMGFLINEKFGSFIMFVSWIIIGISCYKYKKNQDIELKKEKENKEVITMGKYENFILEDNAKAYIHNENTIKDENKDEIVSNESKCEINEEENCYKITLQEEKFFTHLKKVWNKEVKEIEFEVAGTFVKEIQLKIDKYFKKMFADGKIKRYEGLSPKEIKKEKNSEIYEMPQSYKFTNDKLKFINEPQNEYDKNAIRIELNDIGKIGYVPKKINVELKEIFKTKKIFELNAYIDGGKYKKVYEDGSVEEISRDYSEYKVVVIVKFYEK